ncbi:MAG: hypothetical protein U0797_20005 [Gemmataceae bacterium]
MLQSKGYVIPISLVQVSPKVGGQIEWLAERFKEGEKFKKGDLLARLERVDYESDYNQALFALAAVTERLEDLKKTMPEEIKQAEAEPGGGAGQRHTAEAGAGPQPPAGDHQRHRSARAWSRPGSPTTRRWRG